MRLPLKHLALVVLVALAVFVGGVLYPLWRQAVDRNRDARADPHHIAGNLYFVGAPDVTSFLLLGPEGHVLIGSGYEGTAHKIVDNIEQLGFAAKDVKILLATDPHIDEAGGLAALQLATGAELWASEANAEVIAAGGQNDPSTIYPTYRLLAWAGVTDYPAARVDRRVKDGETIRLGPLAVTAHLTPGHSPGCTTWTFSVRDRDRDLHVVHRCGIEPPYGASLVDPERPPGVRADVERSLRTLRDLPVDIWLTSHGVEYGRFRKYQDSLKTDDPAAPFIDPKGYLASIDSAESAFRKQLAAQQQRR
jgi:metallo-beta-lactamase class B